MLTNNYEKLKYQVLAERTSCDCDRIKVDLGFNFLFIYQVASTLWQSWWYTMRQHFQTANFSTPKSVPSKFGSGANCCSYNLMLIVLLQTKDKILKTLYTGWPKKLDHFFNSCKSCSFCTRLINLAWFTFISISVWYKFQSYWLKIVPMKQNEKLLFKTFFTYPCNLTKCSICRTSCLQMVCSLKNLIAFLHSRKEISFTIQQS